METSNRLHPEEYKDQCSWMFEEFEESIGGDVDKDKVCTDISVTLKKNIFLTFESGSFL